MFLLPDLRWPRVRTNGLACQGLNAHSPLRISGSASPSFPQPSMSNWLEPTMKAHSTKSLFPARRGKIRGAHMLAALQGEAIGAAKSKVAGGILVEQGVVEQQARLGDGRAWRNPGDLPHPDGRRS